MNETTNITDAQLGALNPQVQRDLAVRAARRAEMAETSFAQNGRGGAVLLPRNGQELLDQANLMSTSGPMVRDIYRNNPGACAALIMICQPFGFNPFLTSWKTYQVKDGAPIAFEAQLINAMVHSAAPIKGRLRYEYTGEGQSRAVKVTGIDRDSGDVLEYQSPQKGQIGVQNSPLWKSDPDQQLAYYGVRAWCRRWFPEILMGLYAADELEPMRNVTPAAEDGSGFAKLGQAARAAAPKEVEAREASDPREMPRDAAEIQRNAEDPRVVAMVKAEASGRVIGSDPESERGDCPHMDDPELASAWFKGFDAARGDVE